MLTLTNLSGFGARRSGAFRALGLTFDGTNDYLARGADLTGLADGKQGTISFWIKPNATSNYQLILTNWSCTNFFVWFSHGTYDDKVWIAGGGGTPLNLVTASSLSTGSWRHVMASWDVATGTRHLYLDGSSDAGTSTSSDANINYSCASGTNWGVGAYLTPEYYLNADLAELFFHPAYLDLSQAANREKFRTAAGKPADPGGAGANPLGVQPLLYLSARDGESASAFAVNRGSGGAFTAYGSPALSSTTPSD